MKTIINTKYIKNLAFAALALVSVFAYSQEEEEEKKKFSFSGSVDAYYRANFTAPNDENAIAPGSSFANLPGFAMSGLILEALKIKPDIQDTLRSECTV